MSRRYTNLNKIKFTSISEKYQVDRALKSKISELHSSLITYVVNHFKDTKRYKQQVVDVLNIMTYAVYSGDLLSEGWRITNPLENIPQIEDGLVEETLGDIFLTIESIEWDVKPTDGLISIHEENSTSSVSQKNIPTKATTIPKATKTKKSSNTSSYTSNPTPKQDLYIQSPVVPRFDYSKRWIQGHEGADDLVIYTTLPEIPTRQNEISCTTDVTRMTHLELMNLYPNVVIHTRAPILYEHIEGLDYEEDLGVLLPIEGYTREQLVDNIIQYPHFYKLVREVDSQIYSFYTHIEINGELQGILDVWDDLPDTRRIPRQKEFVKEYVVRKYLLDLTLKHTEYKYPLSGSLDPFLTLFMPANDYIARGYKDVENLAKQCVVSRVKYKLSRNPVIRRLDSAKLYI